MLTKHFVIALSLLATTALAQTDSAPSSSPASTETGFESENQVEAQMFLPPDVMKGRLHTVGEQADNDGLSNTYFLYSGGQVFEVTTAAALRTRIRELYALEKLRDTSKTEEFGKAMAAAGK